MLRKITFSTMILTLVFCNLFAKQKLSDLFEIRRIQTNFNGVASNGSTLLAYGTNGVILRSTNLGETWEQVALPDSVNVLKVVNINQNYYGLSQFGIFYSTDEGQTWIAFQPQEKILDIFAYKEQLICILENKIQRYDKNLNLIREHKVDLDSSYLRATIYKNTTLSVAKAGYKLFYYSRDWKLASFNLETNVFKEIDLSNIYPSKKGALRKKLFSNDSDKVYLITNDSLFEYNTEESKIQIVFNQSSFIKNDSQITYLATKDQMYAIYTLTYDVLTIDSVNRRKALDSLFFGLIDKSSKMFVNIKEAVNDRFIANLRINDLKLFNIQGKDIFIAVGNGKLIYISTNGGRNWILKSLLNEEGNIFAFNRYKARLITSNGKFFFTNDGGITWLPQQNYVPIMTYPLNINRFFVDELRGFYRADPQMRKVNYKPPNFYYTLDGGNTVNIATLDFFGEEKSFIAQIQSKIVLLTSLDIINNHKTIQIAVFNDSLKLERAILHSDTLWKVGPGTEQILDSLYITYMFSYGDTLYGLSPIYNDTVFVGYNVLASTNFINWNKIFFLPLPIPDANPIKALQIKDTVLIKTSEELENGIVGTIWAIFLKDHSYKKYILINPAKFDVTLASGVFRHCGKYFVGALPIEFDTTSIPIVSLLSFNLDKDTITDFEEIEYPKEYNPLSVFYDYQTLAKGEVRNGELEDSIIVALSLNNFKPNTRPTVLFLISKPCGEPSGVPDGSFLRDDYFYVTKPYPNPTLIGNTMNFKVYFDPRYSSDEIEIAAYNLLGQKVAERNEFVFQPVNQYSVQVQWKVPALTPGLYFFVVRVGNSTSVRTALFY